MEPLLSPRQFAEAIGVSESSIRRWADGGQIRITRTAGGHRKIPRAEAIRFVRANSAKVVRPDLLEIDEPRHRRGRPEAFSDCHADLLGALEAGDAELAYGLLTRMYVNGVSVAEICDGPIRSVMARIGEMWPGEERAIFIEHRATSICVDVLNRLRADVISTPARKVVAIGGAPQGDPYLLPSLMATTVLADVGFDAVNLGPNTPLEVLAQSALEMEARLVWIATTALLPRSQVEPPLGKLLQALRGESQLVVGGQTSTRYRVPESGHVHKFSSMAEMAGFARGLLAADATNGRREE